ncbi:MAG TPA: hypothetical protein H9824_05995 [Candidatus Bacteroides pullicola]|uniref:Uncharacterized protein n=1 Tax=Candidatus Bacteroides pullicola TaxID=2838475 RepID=A0A9D2CKQ5_9BACE|nr:hypothetical protein [Candidatus Bacteroides pullicola]
MIEKIAITDSDVIDDIRRALPLADASNKGLAPAGVDWDNLGGNTDDEEGGGTGGDGGGTQPGSGDEDSFG